MMLSQFHFADLRWFWCLSIIPIVGLLYLFFYHRTTDTHKLENLVDKHLIPHLLQNTQLGQISVFRAIMFASMLWALLIAAMAGPRWNFTEVPRFTEDKVLLILLDLSKSMDSDDIKPSRFARARLEIEDILNLGKGMKVGLLGFAANAHLISAITYEMSNIKRLLPFVDTDLVFVQGTRLSAALKTAEQMLDSESGTNKSILIISDGGITDEESSISLVSKLAQKGIITHTLGIGTQIGVKFVDEKGEYLQRDGQMLISKLEKNKLQAISAAGGGQYFDTHHSDTNTQQILSLVNERSNFLEEATFLQEEKQWEEEFYIFVFPVMLVILLWFRKGFSLPTILLILLTHSHALGINTIDQLFLNKEQQAKKSLEEIEDFDTAAKLFDDPYKQGVAYYKAGDYTKATECFCNNTKTELQTNSLYNLGNALVMQDRLEEAADAYNRALKHDPNNSKVKTNLGIVKFMLVKVQTEQTKDQEKKKKPQNEGDLLGGGGGGGDDEEDDEEDNGGKDKKNDKDKGNKDRDEGNKGGDKCDEEKNQDKADKEQNKGDNYEGDKDIENNENTNNPGSGRQIGEDQWLDQIPNDYKNFLKNQFYLESQRQNKETQPNIDPW